MEQEHNYEVIKLENGFRVIPKDSNRRTLTYTVNSYGFWQNFSTCPSDHFLPLYGFRRLVDVVVGDIYHDWKSPKENQKFGVTLMIKEWAKKITGRCLNHPIMNVWKETIDTVDPVIATIHRLFFSVASGNGDWFNVKRMLEMWNPYLIKDTTNYRAARIAVLYAHRYGLIAEDRYLGDNFDWLLSYSANGTKYTSLTKTLMNLPGGIVPVMLTEQLPHFILPEPAKSRIRLLSYLVLSRSRNFHPSAILKSSDDEIYTAVKYMWHYFPGKDTTDFRSTQGIIRALNLIFDYEGNWDNLSILGLARRAEEYHHNLELQRRLRNEANQRRMEENRAKEERMKTSDTAKPKIELPDNEHIKFLDTYQSVIEEGEIMEHCIASYARRAVEGSCYLFHVDYDNEMASVEVSPNGYVSQSYGPRDRINKASEYGRKELNIWAKQLIEGK
jgi:hypothetical protein